MIEQSEVQGQKTEKPTFEHTIFKSSYYLGEHLLSLYVNYGRVAKGVISFVIKKGKWNTIYNLTAEERDSFLANCLKQLSSEELGNLLSKVK